MCGSEKYNFLFSFLSLRPMDDLDRWNPQEQLVIWNAKWLIYLHPAAQWSLSGKC